MQFIKEKLNDLYILVYFLNIFFGIYSININSGCDLAAVTKPWNIHKDVVNLVTKEFFAQGDRERLELNKEPNVIIGILKVQI